MANNKTVLIAEDEQPIAKALKLKLEKSGYTAEIAANGQAAMDFISANQVDVMLLDLMMPEVDGFAVLEWVKEQKKNFPIIVSSNLSQESDIARAKELGATDYYVKSDTPIATVVEKIEAAVK